MAPKHFLIDARVIQDHFPGIGRYAFNLLHELPKLLRDDEGERLSALIDPSACNTQHNLAALRSAHPQVHWVQSDVPIFSAKNLWHDPSSAVSRPLATIHFPYHLRPYLCRSPSITSIHDVLSLAAPQYTDSAKTRLLLRITNGLSLLVSRRVFTLSRNAAQDIARLFPFAKNKIVVTPIAADEQFQPQPAERIAAVREQFNLPQRFIIFLASNKPHKNLAGLMQAWRMVMDSGIAADAWLLIAGHEDQRHATAQQLAQQLGVAHRVHSLGRVSDADAAALYSACTAFVFPSFYEGFGLPPLEAMACGAAVACSNTSSLPEVIGDAALQFSPVHPEGIAQAIRQLLNDEALRQNLRARSLQQAKLFSWQVTARITLETYRAI